MKIPSKCVVGVMFFFTQTYAYTKAWQSNCLLSWLHFLKNAFFVFIFSVIFILRWNLMFARLKRPWSSARYSFFFFFAIYFTWVAPLYFIGDGRTVLMPQERSLHRVVNKYNGDYRRKQRNLEQIVQKLPTDREQMRYSTVCGRTEWLDGLVFPRTIT